MSATGLMTTYKPMDITFEKGEGVWLYDTQGNKYLDAISGIAVCGLGHCHPEVTRTLQEQAAKLVHTSNLYRIEHQESLGGEPDDNGTDEEPLRGSRDGLEHVVLLLSHGMLALRRLRDGRIPVKPLTRVRMVFDRSR